MISILEILKLAKQKQASDIHITAGSPPILRIYGNIFKIDTAPLNAEETKTLCYSLISDEQKARLEEEKSLDFSFFVKNVSRFRGTIYFQKASIVGTFRLLQITPPKIKSLNLPSSVGETVKYPFGLVLITGPTGSGKSTTLSAIIDAINHERRAHILTLEDPIEILHSHKKCIVNQREIGVDCKSFADGMKSALRADPDVCLVGEMRDSETIKLSLKLAETGHLVFSTLHTNSASKTIDRIVSSFSVGDRSMILNQLSTVLQAVISQRLIPSKSGQRQVVAEVMFANHAVRNLIREGKIFQIYNVMQTSQSEGMATLNNALLKLIQKNLIEPKEAFNVSYEKEELYQLLRRNNIAA